MGIPNEFPSETRREKSGVQGSHSASGRNQAVNPQVRSLTRRKLSQSAGAQASRAALTPEVHTGGRWIEIYCRGTVARHQCRDMVSVPRLPPLHPQAGASGGHSRGGDDTLSWKTQEARAFL